MGGPGSAGANDSPFIVPLGDCDYAADRVLEGMIPEAANPVRSRAPVAVPLPNELCFKETASDACSVHMDIVLQSNTERHAPFS
jgi:hypothetical protein